MKDYQFFILLGFVCVSHVIGPTTNSFLGCLFLLIGSLEALLRRKESKS